MQLPCRNRTHRTQPLVFVVSSRRDVIRHKPWHIIGIVLLKQGYVRHANATQVYVLQLLLEIAPTTNAAMIRNKIIDCLHCVIETMQTAVCCVAHYAAPAMNQKWEMRNEKWEMRTILTISLKFQLLMRVWNRNVFFIYRFGVAITLLFRLGVFMFMYCVVIRLFFRSCASPRGFSFSSSDSDRLRPSESEVIQLTESTTSAVQPARSVDFYIDYQEPI